MLFRFRNTATHITVTMVTTAAKPAANFLEMLRSLKDMGIRAISPPLRQAVRRCFPSPDKITVNSGNSGGSAPGREVSADHQQHPRRPLGRQQQIAGRRIEIDPIA